MNIVLWSTYVPWNGQEAGTQMGVGALWARRASPAFHTLAKDMSLNRGETHFTLGLRPCIISSFLLYKLYLRPPLKITQLRPCGLEWRFNVCFISWTTQSKRGCDDTFSFPITTRYNQWLSYCVNCILLLYQVLLIY